MLNESSKLMAQIYIELSNIQYNSFEYSHEWIDSAV